MENYLYISTAVSIVALIIIKYGKGASHANYYFSLLAILSWFVPYTYLAKLIPNKVLTEPIILAFSQINASAISTNKAHFYVDIELWLSWGFWGLITVGALLLINRLITLTKWKGNIQNDSSLTLLTTLSAKYQTPIYSANKVSTGLLLGIFKPKIIVSTLITDSKHLDLIICHEKQHLVQNDNLKLMLLAVAECLFWWNPIVRRLININRFYIEAICDENTSKIYGKHSYIEDLASLVLLKHNQKTTTFVCTATSNHTNNIARIKLLKENRKMTFRKKLAYMLIALTAVTTMSWHTLATAISNEKTITVKANQDRLGALVDLDIEITTNLAENVVNKRSAKVTYWMDFTEKGMFAIDDQFTLTFKVTDLGDSASLEYELIESSDSIEKIVSQPKLTVHYGKEATIEVNKPDVSQFAYLIKATPTKATNPHPNE